VAKGKVMTIRYADDLVLGFEHRDEAERFLKEFGERLAKFGLELHPEKTRLIEFGQTPHGSAGRGEKGSRRVSRFWGSRIAVEPQTGPIKIRRQTARKRLEAKLQKIKQTLRSRMHERYRRSGSG